MCGIAGAVALTSATLGRQDLCETVSLMASAIAHRGPDDHGLWSDPSGLVAFAHRRLSIVDLSDRGRQPMSYRNRYTIAFNGEIYNFRELRSSLLSFGFSFASDTDTEVLMAAVLHWGIERALKKMRGMFAFAIWDSEQRVLYLARDRLGEKPLFVCEHDGYLYFGSEMRSIAAIGERQRLLSLDAVGEYLRFGYVPSPLSLNRGVFKFPQGSFAVLPAARGATLRIDSVSGGVSVGAPGSLGTYWFMDEGSRFEGNSFDAVSELKSRITSSVSEQLLCDVPVGVFLSGGIDSTVIAGIAQEISPKKIDTFTVKFDSAGFDESRHAAEVARLLGTNHHEIRISEAEIINEVPAIASSLDEPLANASYFPLQLMARAARLDVKVVLSGDGGDELFCGYNRYKHAQQLWARFGFLSTRQRQWIAGLMGAIEKCDRRQLSMWPVRFRRVSQTDTRSKIKKMRRFLNADTVGEAYRSLLFCWDDPSVILEGFNQNLRSFLCSESDFLRAAMRLDLQCYLPDDNLAKADRATMAVGLEQRVPLLDARIVEFARSIPPRMLLSNGVSKWILRQVAYQLVSPDVLDRPKMGFTVPIGDWLRGPLSQWAGDLICSASVVEASGFNVKHLRKFWDSFLFDDAALAWEMWAVVIYLAWLDANLGRAVPSSKIK